MRSVMALSQTVQRRTRSKSCRDGDAAGDARWRRGRTDTSNPTVLPWIGWEIPVRTPGNEGQAFSVARSGWWKAGRDQKSPLRRCFKSRPPLRAEYAGSPPAADHGCKRRSRLQRHLLREMLASSHRMLRDPRLPHPLAAVRPLVRIPTDRHTTTGTCEIGQAGNKVFDSASQDFFEARDGFSHRCHRVLRAGRRNMNRR